MNIALDFEYKVMVKFHTFTYQLKLMISPLPTSQEIQLLCQNLCTLPENSVARVKATAALYAKVNRLWPIWRNAFKEKYKNMPVEEFDEVYSEQWVKIIADNWICTKYDPNKSTFTYCFKWLLNKRILDKIKKPPLPPVIVPPSGEDDNLVEEIRSLILSIEDLERCCMRSRPDINCQDLLLKRMPPDMVEWKTLAENYGVNLQSISAHYRRNCLPIVQRYISRDDLLS